LLTKIFYPGMGQSFRSRLAQIVFIALLPALVISLIWAWREDHAIRAARLDAASQATALSASRLDNWLKASSADAAIVDADRLKLYEMLGDDDADVRSAQIVDGAGRILVERSFQRSASSPGLEVRRPIGSTTLSLIRTYPPSRYGSQPNTWFWVFEATLVAIAVAISLASVRLVDRTVGSWVNYLRRVVMLLSQGRLSVRARGLDRAVVEIAELGGAINAMASSIGQRAQSLEASIVERDDLLRELQHRVKNNFQVIGNLIGLYKNTIPPTRRAQLRFIEDHIHSMSLVYRSAYRSDDNIHLSPIEIGRSVITALCSNAGIYDTQIVATDSADTRISIDLATGVSLSLAYTLPPFLDARQARLKDSGLTDAALAGRIFIYEQGLVMEIDDIPPAEAPRPPFLQRIAASYISQLKAVLSVPTEACHSYRLEIPLTDEFSNHLDT
jgi:two-component sensor histidine kinase